MIEPDLKRRGFLASTIAAAAVSATMGGSSPLRAAEPHRAIGHRRIGTMQVSPLGLGCASMNARFYNPPFTVDEMRPVFAAAIGAGINFFDTAEAYGPDVNEELVGEILRPHRNSVYIATKFGIGLDRKAARETGVMNSRPEHIRSVVHASLRKLRTDRIDLLYQHRVDPAVPIEEVAGTIKQLIAEGKVVHWGMSEPGMATLRRAHAELPVAAVQNEYSLLERAPREHFDTFEELGVAFVPWSPLGHGLLTGALNANTRFDRSNYTDWRFGSPRFTPEGLTRNMPLVALLREWSERKNGATPAQLSLAWLIAQKPWIVPIPGTTSVAHLRDNLGGLDVAFAPEEFRAFDEAALAIPVHGSRAVPAQLRSNGVEAAPLGRKAT